MVARNPKSTDGQFVIDGRTAIVIAEGEDAPTRLAAEALARDVEMITGRRPDVTSGPPPAERNCIFIASASNAKVADTLRRLAVDSEEVAGEWEAYLFKAAGSVLVICGGDPLATMRGVYGFSRIALGVDPLYRWTGIRPARRTEISLRGIDQVIGSPTFKFRGWFLNAGHLIRWNLGRGPEFDLAAKYGALAGQTGISGAFGREMTEMVVESALRSDMNFLIPLSYLDLDDPNEKLVADVCREHGIFLSHHHQEPVGANLRYWERFWQARGGDAPEMSFYKNPEAFEVWWRHYIEAWSKYERVVWVLGHRGPGDRPFWLKDAYCPDTMEAHGKCVSDAIQMQLRLIREVCGDREAHYCATLWQDGAAMHAADKLRFPPGTMVVMADHGGKQMMQEDFYSTPRRENLRYGVYYHVCYGPGGPIWAQGNSVDRMWYNMEQLTDRGETSLALLNVGNIRPYLPGLAAWTAITTDAEGFEPEAFLQDWCAAHFGADRAEELAEAYNAFFALFITPYRTFYDGHRGFWDGVLNNESWRMFQIMYAGDVEAGYKRIKRPFPDAWTFLTFHRNKTAAVRGAWDALCKRAREISKTLDGPAQDLFEDNFAVQAEILRALYHATYFIATAALALRDGEKDKALAFLAEARRKSKAGCAYAVRNGNRGVYEKWFTMRNPMGMDFVRVIDDMVDKLEGREPKSAAARKRIDRIFSLPEPGRSD